MKDVAEALVIQGAVELYLPEKSYEKIFQNTIQDHELVNPNSVTNIQVKSRYL